jgi:multicomponent Na+:H+ antiporter subunit E
LPLQRLRAGFLLALWVVLIGIDPLDFAVRCHRCPGGVGEPAAASSGCRLRITAALALVPRFLWQSVVAGVDVARRAFAPSVPLSPGFAAFPVGLPRGPLRNWFATISSLMPGTVPVEDEREALVYHCLDTTQPVVEQLKAEEQAWAPALRGPHG